MRMMRACRRSIADFGRTGETCKGKEDAESSGRDERSARADLAERGCLTERRATGARDDRRREETCIGSL